jgi:hypothetical protein
MPSSFSRKAPNINIEVTEIKTPKGKICYTTGNKITLKPNFPPTGNRLMKLQASHTIQIKTINPMILKCSKKNNPFYLFRIGIIKMI